MNKFLVPLIVAIVLGLGAAATVYNMMTKGKTVTAAPSSRPRRKWSSPSARYRAWANPLWDEDLTAVAVEWEESDPSGIFATPDPRLSGRVAMMPIGENQPVLVNMLADQNAGAGLQALLSDGTRAITLQVDEVSGVGGLLLPGCRVDLLTSIHEGSSDSLLTRTLVQDVKVIAVGQTLGTPATDGGIARSVTLVVSPTQAETIELASNVGRPRLVLRSGVDHTIFSDDGIRLSESMSSNKLQALASNTHTGSHTVEIIRGGTESVVTFSGDNVSSGPAVAVPSVAGGKSDTAPIGSR